MANGEILPQVLVKTVQNQISLIPKSKSAVTVLKDSDITGLPIAVVHVHYIKSLTELVDLVKVIVWRTVLQLLTVNSGILPQTCV